jgi:hypothetical protein
VQAAKHLGPVVAHPLQHPGAGCELAQKRLATPRTPPRGPRGAAGSTGPAGLPRRRRCSFLLACAREALCPPCALRRRLRPLPSAAAPSTRERRTLRACLWPGLARLRCGDRRTTMSPPSRRRCQIDKRAPLRCNGDRWAAGDAALLELLSEVAPPRASGAPRLAKRHAAPAPSPCAPDDPTKASRVPARAQPVRRPRRALSALAAGSATWTSAHARTSRCTNRQRCLRPECSCRLGPAHHMLGGSTSQCAARGDTPDSGRRCQRERCHAARDLPARSLGADRCGACGKGGSGGGAATLPAARRCGSMHLLGHAACAAAAHAADA